jgi:hypothetical protein
MMEAVHTSETSAYFSEATRRYIPEDYHLHVRRRENLKSHSHKFNYLGEYYLLKMDSAPWN